MRISYLGTHTAKQPVTRKQANLAMVVRASLIAYATLAIGGCAAGGAEDVAGSSDALTGSPSSFKHAELAASAERDLVAAYADADEISVREVTGGTGRAACRPKTQNHRYYLWSVDGRDASDPLRPNPLYDALLFSESTADILITDAKQADGTSTLTFDTGQRGNFCTGSQPSGVRLAVCSGVTATQGPTASRCTF